MEFWAELCAEGRDIPHNLIDTHSICRQYHEGMRYPTDPTVSGGSENEPFPMTRAIRCSLAFLERDFAYVQKRGMAVKQGFGWSSTFTNAGFALFLFNLYQGDAPDKGTLWLCARAASAIELDPVHYCEGLPRDTAESCADCFWRVFRAWREHHGCEEKEQVALLCEMECLVDLRLEGIMSANRQNYYDECAAYVAGLAELKASGGEVSRKQGVQAYKACYSRRRAFHEELRRFGMAKELTQITVAFCPGNLYRAPLKTMPAVTTALLPHIFVAKSLKYTKYSVSVK